MAEKKKNEFLAERQELSKNKMTNRDNQLFARVQSTPLDDQQKKFGALKKTLKVSNAAAFIPGGGGTSAVASFLGTNAATETPSFTAPAVNKPINGFNTSTNDFIPGQPTTASKPFTSAQTAPVTQTSGNTTPQTTNAPTGTVASIEITKQPSETNPDGTQQKKKLRLGSSAFNANSSGGAAPAVPGKTSPVKKAGAPGNTISLASQKIGGGKDLGSIAENVAEEKQEKAPAAKPFEPTENKKPEPTQEFRKYAKPREEESKAGRPFTPGQNVNAKTAAAEAAEKDRKEKEKREREENERKEAEKKRAEAERLENERKEKEEKDRLEKERLENEKREREENERKEAERKKAEAEKAAAKKEVKIEIVVMSRVDLENAVNKIAESLKDRRLPEVFEKIRAREIILESSRKNTKQQGGYKQDAPPVKQIDRNTQPLPSSEDGGMMRGSMVRKETTSDAPKPMLVRTQLTEEERRKKDELCNNVGVWIKSKKAEQDPEEATRKEIKFNLNIITIDNFEVIKEKIHDLAAAKSDNCKRVAEFIIENAWTQKQYVNTYAKLCDYLGRSEKLYFDDSKNDSKKKKNQFKLHIMKQIQTVFEEESQTNFGFKKPVEEMDKEERTLYYQKKKQRILGNVSFIGELFLEKFLVIGIVRIITTSLLQKFLEEYSAYQKAVTKPETKSYEDSLEGLLKFYEIIGRSVEEKEAAKPVDIAKSNAMVANFQKILNTAHSTTPSSEAVAKLDADEVSFEGLFKIFDIVLNQAALSNRLDSLVKNLIHRKENKWVASISKNQGPKTLKELHDEFEREQMEIERSGDAYREELMSYGYQPRDQGRQQRGGQKEVYFQVAQESKSKQAEETKIDMKSINVDTNISFKPNRGKAGDKVDPKAAQKKPRISFEEIDKELKEVYKILNGEQIEDKGTAEEEVKKLATKFGGKELLHVFYRDFYDGRIEAVKKRLFIPNLLVESKAINEDEFFEEFTRAMHRMFEVACDYPGSDASYATIFLEYCKKAGDLSPLDKISFPKEFYDNEDCDLVLEFYQDFFRAFIKGLEDDYPELEAKEDTLKEFAKRIKIEDYEDFKTTI